MSPDSSNPGRDTPVIVSMADVESDGGQAELSSNSSFPSFLMPCSGISMDRYRHKWMVRFFWPF